MEKEVGRKQMGGARHSAKGETEVTCGGNEGEEETAGGKLIHRQDGGGKEHAWV